MPLEALVREAQALGAGRVPAADTATETAAEQEFARVLQICNACRYCEGFCAVFPAITRRLAFPKADLHYLANLCHNCGACFHACQYAPPHEFAVNVPRATAQVRLATYADFAWPRAFGALYRRNGAVVALAVALGLALFVLLAFARNGTLWPAPPGGDFYAVLPHNLMVALFAPVFGYACIALALGVRGFRREISQPGASPAAVREAAANALRLTYLDGGHGEGCNERDDAFTPWRRRFHHATFYGFLLCFASTATATFYHYVLGLKAPYPLASAPVVLGTVGGVALALGVSGLFVLNLRRSPLAGDAAQKGMDRGLIVLLFLVSVSGLALLAWRETAAMAVLLAAHLGFVAALFLTMPYGKFAHGAFRVAALLQWAVERRQPNRLTLDDG